MKQLILEIKKIAAQNPKGFTVFFPSLEPVTSGWVVAVKETQNCFGEKGLTFVIAYVTANNTALGAWKEGSKWYWDACLIFTNEMEATQAGIENEQIAIYNIETNYLKYL